jgi:hypothetical protein
MTVRDPLSTFGAQAAGITPRERDTFRVAMLLFIAGLASTVFDLYLFVQLQTWQAWGVAGVALVFTVTSLVSARMSRRAKSDLGAALEITQVTDASFAAIDLELPSGMLSIGSDLT